MYVDYSSLDKLFNTHTASLTSSRTFVTQGTLVSERTTGISHQSLAQAVGYVLGPGNNAKKKKHTA